MKDISAISTETLALTCPYTGYPIESIFWERDDSRLPNHQRQKVYPNGTLVIVNVESSDQGKYKCIVADKDGKHAQSQVQVKVLIPPAIDPFVFSKSLLQGQRYTILCSVSRGDMPLQIRWYKDGEEIRIPNFAATGIMHVSPFSSNLIFESLRSDHKGNYTCEVTNGVGSVSYTGQMVIHVLPKWLREPADSMVLKDRTAVIDCEADGFPVPSIRWSHTDVNSKEQPTEYKPVVSSSHMKVFENGSLVIHTVQLSDAGYYACQANNGIGSGLSKVIRIKVLIPAHFGTKFRLETVLKDHKARLKCEAKGDKPLTLSWMKDKIPLKVLDDSRYRVSESVIDDGLTSEVTITAAERKDSGLYTCVAFNSHGDDETNVQLIVQERPDGAQDVRIIDYDARSAKVSWAPPFSGNSPIIHYVVQYKVEGDKWTSRGPVDSSTSVIASETSIRLRNLKPVTNYELRIVAVNNIGKSDSSEVILFRTDEEAPAGVPLNVKATATSSKSVEISWEPPRKDLHYGHVRGYYVGYKESGTGMESEAFVYKTLEIDGRTAAAKADRVGDGSSLGSMGKTQLTGLKRFAKYAIVVQAFNSKGAGPASEEIVVQTLQNASGSDSDDHDSNPVTGYFLYHKKLDSTEWEELRLSSQQNVHKFDYLACGTKYQYYLVAFNAFGRSDSSDTVTGKTDGMAPVAPHKNSMLSLNSTMATVHLDAWHDGLCRISSFGVSYKVSRKRNWITLDNAVHLPEEKTLHIGDLLPATGYDLKITAHNEAGQTEARYSFTTVSLIKAPAIVHGRESAHSNPIRLDVGLVVPATICLVTIFLVLLYGSVRQLNKRPADVQSDGLTGTYESVKCKNGSEIIRLSEMDQKRLSKCAYDTRNSSSMVHEYPTTASLSYPATHYQMAHFEAQLANGEHGHTYHHSDGHCEVHGVVDVAGAFHVVTSPLKAIPQSMTDRIRDEPLYATVKRTARSAPRPDVTNIYQYPLTSMLSEEANCGDSSIASDSMCDSESSSNPMVCNGLGSSSVHNGSSGPARSSSAAIVATSAATTAFMRLREEPAEKSLSGAPAPQATLYHSVVNVHQE
ncbi:Down syndrome cell adhesion molecule-like protein Dscam2 [Halotydeus destructor]|nr:Down syndrome cell adhesion molecule-like protein Dscam2 [Halotydeus destructor]